MKRRALTLLFGVAILLAPLWVWAQVAPTHVEFDFSGTGNLLVSPVVYSGTVDAGEPLLVGGSWDLTIDDSGWPPDTDKLARWNYIDATYFAPNYSGGFWTATFDENTTASAPIWHVNHLGNGMWGTAVIQVTVQDFDMDAVIDPDERAFSVFSGTLIVVRDGTGIWYGYCGLGSFSGFSSNPDPANWADDAVSGHTVIDVQWCDVPAPEISWGAIKALYE
jgi:hypothetical protein